MKATIGVAMMGLATAVSAADYPAKTITMIVPYGAGGITDTMGRITAAEMQKTLGKKIVVVNKTGAAGTIGMTDTARARADGYTISMIPAAPLAIQPHLRKLNYDLNSYTYICQTFDSPIVLAAKPDSKFSNFADVIEYAKAHPDELTYSSAGAGSLPQISMVRVLKNVGAKMRHVPMAGDAGAITAALGGHVDVAIIAATSVIGKDVKNIAVFADKRADQLPDAPTAKEVGYDYEFSLWGGVIAPKGIPEEAVTALSAACETAVASPDYAKEMAKMASAPAYKNGADFNAFAAKETKINGDIIKTLDLTGG
jgi:tripartite-type tricarboxylate transporter receptor subunit TctC